MSTIICSKCGIEKAIELFEERPDAKNGRRTYCRDCKKIQVKSRQKIKLNTDDDYFWKLRSKSLNNFTGRRNGKAGIIIKESVKIKYVDLKLLYDNSPCCNYCKVPLSKESIVFDHAYPLSRNGEHNIKNIRISCQDCNQLKGTRTEEEFLSFIKSYINRFTR